MQSRRAMLTVATSRTPLIALTGRSGGQPSQRSRPLGSHAHCVMPYALGDPCGSGGHQCAGAIHPEMCPSDAGSCSMPGNGPFRLFLGLAPGTVPCSNGRISMRPCRILHRIESSVPCSVDCRLGAPHAHQCRHEDVTCDQSFGQVEVAAIHPRIEIRHVLVIPFSIASTASGSDDRLAPFARNGSNG